MRRCGEGFNAPRNGSFHVICLQTHATCVFQYMPGSSQSLTVNRYFTLEWKNPLANDQGLIEPTTFGSDVGMPSIIPSVPLIRVVVKTYLRIGFIYKVTQLFTYMTIWRIRSEFQWNWKLVPQ